MEQLFKGKSCAPARPMQLAGGFAKSGGRLVALMNKRDEDKGKWEAAPEPPELLLEDNRQHRDGQSRDILSPFHPVQRSAQQKHPFSPLSQCQVVLGVKDSELLLPWVFGCLMGARCSRACRGNWIGEAPYKTGRPCSECPPSYGGGCQNNLCYRGTCWGAWGTSLGGGKTGANLCLEDLIRSICSFTHRLISLP